jgi:hypothetical protein
MKKVYLSMAMLAVSGSLFAQAPTAQRELFSIKNNNTVAEAPMQTKALGITVWSDDFSVSSDWTIGAANLQGQWEMVSTTPAQISQYMGAMASTSNANGFGAFNGVQYLLGGFVDQQNAILEYNNTIDLSTYPYVILEFEQRYRAFNSDRTIVELSTDGATWTEVEVNIDVITNDPAIQNLVRVDVSPYIGGSATARVRFRWEELSGNDSYGSGYGWMVDDVNIVTKPNNDIKTGDNDWGSLGLHYYQIPLTQVAPIDFWTMVSNEGSDTQTGVMLNVDVNSGANTGSSAGVSIAATASDSLVVTSLFTPSANGTYTFTMDITADLVDDVPANNVLTGNSFVVNDYIYARDTDGNPSPGGGEDNGSLGDFAFEAGSYFDAFATEAIFGLDVTIGNGTPDGTIIYGKLYVWDGSAFTYVDETAEYTVTSAEAASNANISLELFTHPSITAGSTYLAVVGCYSEFYYGVSGYSPDQTSFIMYGGVGGTGSQYYTNGTPMVRMNFDPSLAIAEVSQTGAVLGQNMPNPFDNNSTINFELTNTSDVQFEFVDMTGKVVKTIDLGTLTNGTHSIQVDATEFASGVYYYSLVSEGSKITSKMIVQK